MARTKLVFLIIIVVLLLSFIVFIIVGLTRRQRAELSVDANLNVPVFVSGKQVGMTPYRGTFNPDEVVVKVLNYETRVTLQPGINTVIERDFDKTGSASSGELVSFEKDPQGDTSMSVVSSPGAAQVILDGVSRGFTPLRLGGLVAGSHKLDVAASGYVKRSFSINVVTGYKLVAVVDLMADSTSRPVSSSSAEVQTKKEDVLVTILETPNGFLRVRSGPLIASDEIGQVHPGEKYKFLKKDEKTGWYQIQFTASSSGWISNTYAATSSGTIKN